MNLERIIEWGAIILAVILGARWLGGLFGAGDPVQSVGPQMGIPGWSNTGSPYQNGMVIMYPGIVGNPGRFDHRGRGYRR